MEEKNLFDREIPVPKINTSAMKKTYWRYHELILYLIFAAFLAFILIPLITLLYFFGDLSSKDRLMNRNNTGITLLDSAGKQFFTFDNPKQIQYVPLSSIPKAMQDAVIASEDKNFYTNPGVSISGIGRALLVDIRSGSLSEGGSTITQELVKNALLSSNKNFLRKFQEVVLAYVLSKRYSKNDILELYLNSVYFGEGAFGVENAAETYFGEDAKDLTVSQSSLLAALLPAPSALSPLSNDPSLAKNRQETVLSEMASLGYLNEQQVQDATNTQLAYNTVKKTDTNVLAPHFALYVKDLLAQKYGEDTAVQSGYVVTTTLNSTWQQYAETAVKNQISYLKYDKASNGAVVVIDPKTGEIEVMVGSYDWNDPNFGKANMAVSPRQPGSSFKPFIYSDALLNRIITPATILQDVKTTFPGDYQPLDYDKSFRGPVTVRRALANSLNIPAVEVMQKVGVANGVNFAKNTFGLTSLEDPSKYGLALVLGAAEIPLLEMTDGYATFADQGMYNPPTAILSIRDKYNNEVYKYTPSPQQQLDPGVAFLISSILSDNAARAEEFGNVLTISRTAAVKTGTTEDFRDALTIGYTPSITVGVWVGNNDNTPMDNIAGSLGAAPIWRQLMEEFLAGTPVERFSVPQNIIETRTCPYKATASPISTTSAYPEFFLSGTEFNYTCNSLATPSYAPTQTPTLQPTLPPQAIPAPQQPAANQTQTSSPTPAPSPSNNLLPSVSPSQILNQNL